MIRSLLFALFYVPILSVFVIGVNFSAMVVNASARRHLTQLIVAWAGASLLLGYVWYRGLCAMPLTCDVGGYAYWRDLVPKSTLLWGFGFGASLVVIHRRRNRGVSQPRSDVLLGGTATVLGFMVASALLHVLRMSR